MRYRRKVLPASLVPAYEAFLLVLEELEPATSGLAEVLPTNRLPGRPLVDALGDFEARLGRARLAMPPWRRPEVDEVWRACLIGLDRSLALAARLRSEAPDLGGFEGLLGTVQALLDPLDPFEEAAVRFSALRLRTRGSGPM